MDLETKHVTDLISYPEGPYNRGGGPTGICFMGDYLYWGDQTTATVHRAKLTGGTLTEHDAAYMHASDPQSLYCERASGRLYVPDVDVPNRISIRSGSAPAQVLQVFGAADEEVFFFVFREGEHFWLGGYEGLYVAETNMTSGQLNATLALEMDSCAGHKCEFVSAAIDHTSAPPSLFMTTYDWSGLGVLRAPMDRTFTKLQSKPVPVPGTGCKTGSEMAWDIAFSGQHLLWTRQDDQDNFMIVSLDLSQSNQSASIVYNGAQQQGYGLAVVAISQGPAALLV